jgi:hypothetical protein
MTRLEKSWRDLQESYDCLSDSQMTRPGVSGDWSVRDVLAHVTTWEQEALKHLPAIITGVKPLRYSVAYGGINRFNRIMTEQKRDLTLAEVQQNLEDTHRQLIRYIESVHDEQIRTETPFRHRLRLDTYSHYPKHAEAIRRWRSKQLNGKEKS